MSDTTHNEITTGDDLNTIYGYKMSRTTLTPIEIQLFNKHISPEDVTDTSEESLSALSIYYEIIDKDEKKWIECVTKMIAHEYPTGLFKLGNYYHSIQDDENAILLWEQSGLPTALLNAATVYFKQQKYDKTISITSQILSTPNIEMNLYLGAIAMVAVAQFALNKIKESFAAMRIGINAGNQACFSFLKEMVHNNQHYIYQFLQTIQNPSPFVNAELIKLHPLLQNAPQTIFMLEIDDDKCYDINGDLIPSELIEQLQQNYPNNFVNS